jgi:hypothetical protein
MKTLKQGTLVYYRGYKTFPDDSSLGILTEFVGEELCNIFWLDNGKITLHSTERVNEWAHAAEELEDEA